MLGAGTPESESYFIFVLLGSSWGIVKQLPRENYKREMLIRKSGEENNNACAKFKSTDMAARHLQAVGE